MRRGWSVWVRLGSAAVMLLVVGWAQGQVPGVPGVPGMGGIGQPGQRGQVAFPDTAEQEAPKRKVARALRRVSPDKVRYTTYSADSIFYDVFDAARWDEADTLAGWVQSLGSIGKPQLRWLDGLTDQHRETQLYRDPLTGRADVYTLTPERQLPYYDTRTPFVRIRFDQAAKLVQLLSFDISQNITPFWNATVHYRRRTSQGAYIGATVDHYAVGATMSFTSFSRRFAATVGAVANLQTDQLNGGIRVANLDSALAAVDADKFTVPVQLSGAVLQRRTRLVHAVGSLRLLGDTANAITLVAGGRMLEAWRKYTDGFTGRGDSLLQTQNALRYRPYGRLTPPAAGSWALGGFSDEYLVYNPSGFAGARINLRLGALAATLQGEYELSYLWAQDSLPGNPITQSLEQTKNTVRAIVIARDTAPLPRFRLTAVGELSTNTLLGEEFKLTGQLEWGFGQQRVELLDSQWREVKTRFIRRPVRYSYLHVPLRLEAQVLIKSQNPSLFDARWRALTFEPNGNLSNEGVLSVAGGVRWQQRPRTAGGYPLLSNYASARVFFSSLIDPVVYDTAAQAVQALGGQLLWQGVTVSGRVRWWHLYFENRTTAQVGTATGDVVQRYARAQPNLFGTAAIYFRDKVFKEGETYLQAGLEGHYFSGYHPLSFEPSLQSWYPQLDRRVPGYLRLDAYVTASIGNALVYVRFTHLNEGIGDVAYVTTPYYPMLERTFAFGIVWRFFD